MLSYNAMVKQNNKEKDNHIVLERIEKDQIKNSMKVAHWYTTTAEIF